MHLRCDDRTARLLDVADLKRLHVELAGSAPVDGALGDFGLLDGEHAWLEVEALRRGAHALGVTPDWDDDFDAMIEYANAKGWSSADGARVRAHVVRLEPVTLPAAWSANWRAAREKTFLHDVDGTAYRGSDLLDATARIAGRLHGAGLERGDRVLLSGATSARFVIAHCAALRLGLVVVPVNKAFSRREVDVIAGLARPKAAIVDEPSWRDCLSGDVIVTGVDVDLPDAAPPELDTAAADDVALLPFTSGTTGTPKGVLLSHGNALAGAESVRLAWHWGPEDTLILSLPLFHMHGLGVGVHGSLLAGSTLLLQEGFAPERVLAACADASMFFGVPTMYARLVEAAGVERLGALRLCVSGSAPLSAELHRRVRERTGQVVLERYGMTETLMLVSNPYDGERRPGTVGLALPGVELRLDEGSGEILVRGPNVFSGYLDLPEATAAAFTGDGFLRTGDIGELDEAGYLRIVGRAKELIITGGHNVYPREVEDVLRGDPSVVDVAVAGTPSDEWGEVVTAYVVVDDELDVDRLSALAERELAPYKRPRLFHRLETLPRNAMGKVQRDELRPPS